MCDAKPGVRCASDTRTVYQRALTQYESTHPHGPSLDPLTAAHAGWEPRQHTRRRQSVPVRTEANVSDRSRTRFRHGQSLALAVGLARKLDLPTVTCAFDQDHRLIHAWVMTEPDRMQDVDGERDFEGFAETLDREHPGWSLEQVDTEDARSHAEEWTSVRQRWASGVRTARDLANHADETDWWG